ncbi:hypothetical protein RCL_jg3904.t2 [Rhizophagus clarus]|uniref:Uncharacterized protein n=1 Tax=Rhizophagus clarus TaxID=94130 RepID=A0A8H3KTZ8_9GLOM|nr:hypothetical protein RCL_jg3904.t2 [Rhizophagus clarus]
MLSFCKVEDQEGRESAFFVYFSALIKHFSALSTSTNSVGGVWAVVKGEVHLQKIYEKIILLVIEDKNAGIPNLRKKVAEDERIAHNNPQLFSLQIENQIDLSLLDSEIPHIMIDINCTDRALILIRVLFYGTIVFSLFHNWIRFFFIPRKWRAFSFMIRECFETVILSITFMIRYDASYNINQNVFLNIAHNDSFFT